MTARMQSPTLEFPASGDVESGGRLSEMSFDELRQREFARLDARGEAYLDYTGSALPLDSHVRWHCDLLRSEVFGNPHSENPTSRTSTGWAEAARWAVLSWLDADPAEYDVVFTANASAAAKLIGESFPFGPHSRLVLAADNHNSVLGIREYARAAGVTATYVPLDAELRLCDPLRALGGSRVKEASLFAFPAQSNFSGVRHPIPLVTLARGLGYTVLLDAAAFVPTAALSLREVPADFVSLSLYKVLGYPTGVGVLVARRGALDRLRRPWFAGGTVEFSSVQNDQHILRRSASGFEDGTPNFLALSAVPRGLDLLHDLGMARIGDHVARMTARLLEGLLALRHFNGRAMVCIHGPSANIARGGTVAFNVVDRQGRWIHHADVEAQAAAAGVSVRSGCFCNPGAAERAFGFDAERAAQCIAASLHPDRNAVLSKVAFARCMDGAPVGAVRASVGIATNERDITRLIDSLDAVRY